MYATDESITCTIVAFALAAALAAVPGAAPQDWRESPEYVALFAPPAHRDAYRAYVSPLPIEALIRTLADDPTLLHPPGAWSPRPTLPIDAFGGPGRLDRWALARLYGARWPLVARGPRGLDGRVAESWTLVSPYPDVRAGKLEPGTLILVLRLAPL